MIARFLFENPRILLLALCVIIVAGVSSFVVMPRLEDPVLGRRVGVISTAFPGADSHRVESLVSIRLEKELHGISEIEQVRSNSRTGISTIVVHLADRVDDVEPVWTRVRNRIDDAQENLPEGCLPSHLEVIPLKAFAAIVALKPKSEGNPNWIVLRRLATTLREELANLSGTESVKTYGDPGEEFVVELEAEDLASLGLPVAAIASQIGESNVNHPGGHLRKAGSEIAIDLDASLESKEELERTIVRLGPSGQVLPLSDIANIRHGVVEPAGNWALVDGDRAIVLGAYVLDESRVDHWTRTLEATVADFQARYDSDIDLEIIFSQSDFIESRMKQLLRNLLLGTLTVVAVVFVLMGWRSMVVVGAILPLSALMVLAGMRAMEIPIHQMSVTGLIVALGLLIDNAIVMVEDLRRRIFEGASRYEAIKESVWHLAIPLFGSTLTTTLAFLPIATLPGPSGEFVGTIAISVILAIGSSFLLAMTVTPAMLCLTGGDLGQKGFFNYGLRIGFLRDYYERSLNFVFRFPLIGVLFSAALPITGFIVAGDLPEQFFPASDRNQIQIEVELPARESATRTLETVRAIQETIARDSRIERVHWFIGASAPTFYYNVVPRRVGTPFYAQAIVDLTHGSRPRTIVRFLQEILDREHLECRTIVRLLEQGPPFDAPIEVRVSGPDPGVLHQLGTRIRLQLSETPDVLHTRSDFEETVPKLVVNLHEEDSSRAGLTETAIAQHLYTTLEGAPAGKIVMGEEEVPIRVRLTRGDEAGIRKLAALPIPVRFSQSHLPQNPGRTSPPPPPPLSALAEVELSSDRAAVVRIDGERTNEIKGYIRAGVLPSKVVAQFQDRLEDSGFQLPDGYTLAFGGEKAERTNAIRELIANAVVLFALMILTLVVSFRSFRHAGIVVMVGGLSIGLGPLALWLFGYPFGFMAIVGTMGLVGLAINDSIVVLAAIRENVAARAGDRDELRGVVVAATRHIIATTLTTIVGFLPLIVGGGLFWPPLAIAIAGGVGGATFLALYLVPSMVLLVNRGGSQGESLGHP